MTKSTKKLCNLAILGTFLVFAGCGSNSESAALESGKAAGNQMTAVNLDFDKTARAEKDKGVLYRQEKQKEKLRTLPDGSQYMAMKDAYGNKLESRYFEDEHPIKYVSLRTFADGTTVMQIKTRDGRLKTVKPGLIEKPWQNNAREIALIAGVSLDFATRPEAVSKQPVRNPISSKSGGKTIKIDPEFVLKPDEALPAEMPAADEPDPPAVPV